MEKTRKDPKKLSYREIKKISYGRSVEDGKLNLKIKIIRRIASAIVKVLLYTPVTANQVSVFAIILAFTAGILFAFGNFIYSIIAIILMFLSEELDYVDGTLARCKFGETKMQSYYVSLPLHRICPAFLLVGISISLFIKTNNILYLVAGFVSAFSLATIAYFLEMKNLLICEYNANLLKTKKLSERGRLFAKSRLQNLAYELFNLPLAQLEFVILIAFILNKFGGFAIITLFYAAFLFIRTLIFSVLSYFHVKKIETQK